MHDSLVRPQLQLLCVVLLFVRSVLLALLLGSPTTAGTLKMHDSLVRP
jgi:hypothetical protein